MRSIRLFAALIALPLAAAPLHVRITSGVDADHAARRYQRGGRHADAGDPVRCLASWASCRWAGTPSWLE